MPDLLGATSQLLSHGDGEVRLLDVKRARPAQVATFSIPDGKVGALAFSPEGRMLAVGDGERVRFFDLGLTVTRRPLRRTWIALATCLAGLARSGRGPVALGGRLLPTGSAVAPGGLHCAA